MMDTTLCISKKDLEILRKVEEESHISRSELLITALREYTDMHAPVGDIKRRIAYRKRDGAGWLRLHIYLSEPEYEFLLDIRRFLKVSISLIISIAINQYLSKMISLIKQRKTDNYRIQAHIIIAQVVQGVQCLYSWWGIPEPEGELQLENGLYYHKET